jgi:hypothetical protein
LILRCCRDALLASLALLGTSAPLGAQLTPGQAATITGRVAATSGVPIHGVALELEAAVGTPHLTTATDRLGRFRITGVAAGAYVLRARHIGYVDTDRSIRLESGESAVIELVLEEQPVELRGVTVQARRARGRFEQEAGATVRQLDAAEIRRIPGLAEPDVLRAVELLPGVISTSDFTTSYNVRGGSSDQNLILLDGLPVYNPFHLGGVFSVFNADMVARSELFAGGIPARFGGRVSSVLSIESDPGDRARELTGGISLLAGRLAAGGALPSHVAQRAGLRHARGRVAARRSYFDQLMRPFFDFPYYLSDLQLYSEGWTNRGDRLSVTGYTGRDVLNLTTLQDFPLQLRWGWGNDLIGARWTRAAGADAVIETHVGYSRFATDLGLPEFDDTEFRSRMNQTLIRTDLDARDRVGRWRFGAELNRLGYDNLAATGGTVFRAADGSGWLLGAYGQRDIRSGSWLVELGVRGDGWLPDRGQSAWVPAPRIAVKRFLTGGDLAVKAAAGRYTQYVHSLRDEELPLGIDIWVIADERAPHTVSDQLQAGVEGFLEGDWAYGIEAFWRRFRGVVTNNFADDPNDPTDDLLDGTGLSWGGDLYVQRESGRLRPALTLSMLRATRTFPDYRVADEPLPRVTYAPIFDRRLDVDLLIRADLPRAYQAAARIHVGTGLPYTRPVASYTYYDLYVTDGRRTPEAPGADPIGVVLGERNRERYPIYQRIDMSLRRESRFLGGWLTWYVEVLNVLNRRNVLFYFYELDARPPVRSGISMFPILPTLGVEFQF